MKKYVKACFKPMVVVAGLVLLSGCNTVKGLGQDIASGGEVISHGASEAQHNINSGAHYHQQSPSTTGHYHRAV